MIKFKKFLVSCAIIAVLATVMQIIDQLLASYTFIGSYLAGGGSWIAFQAWAVYFLGGCNVKGGVKGFLGYVAGIIASIGIIAIGSSIGGFFGIPLMVLIIVVPCIALERVEIMSYVPALFIGAGAYFGIMTYIGGSFVTMGLIELFYCLFGLVWGWLTIKFRGAYEATAWAQK